MAKDFTLGGRDCIGDHTIARDITLELNIFFFWFVVSDLQASPEGNP